MTLNQNPEIHGFLNNYDSAVIELAEKYGPVIKEQLPEINEQLDIPASMIYYSFGKKYSDVLCTLILSKKGVKLGFFRGSELPDPNGLLTGKGKVHRYVELNPEINVSHISDLLNHAFRAYSSRINK